MYQILKALDHAHSRGVMIRDVGEIKNMAFDHSKRKVTLLDLGRATFYHPYQENFWNYNNKKHFATPIAAPE